MSCFVCYISASLTYPLISPQPFHVTEVVACDYVKSTDRLYVDEKGFVANILVDVRIPAQQHIRNSVLETNRRIAVTPSPSHIALSAL